jgi:hypothetical protein
MKMASFDYRYYAPLYERYKRLFNIAGDGAMLSAICYLISAIKNGVI